MKSGMLLLASLLILTSAGRAQTNQIIGGGFLMYYFDYAETLPTPLKSAESGWLPGFRLNYSYRSEAFPIYDRLLFELTNARTDYNGTTQVGDPLSLKSSQWLARVELNAGFSFRRIGGGRLSISPYIGVGYRYWRRLIGDSDPRGLPEDYSWWYVPLGVHTTMEIRRNWLMQLDVAARLMFSGAIKLDFGGVDERMNSPVANLGSVVGWRVLFSSSYRMGEHFVATFGPWYEYSAIGKSNDVIVTQSGVPLYRAYEPSSRTNLLGFDLGVTAEF